MGYWIKRVAIIVAVVGGFLTLWISTWLQSVVMVWAIYILWGCVAVGAVVGGIRHARSTSSSPRNPTQIDPNVINEVYLGRTPATFAESAANLSAQIIEPPHPDPLQLPERPDESR